MKLAFVREGVILKELDAKQIVHSVRANIEAEIADDISQLFLLKRKTRRVEVLEILKRYNSVYTKSVLKALKQKSVSIH